MLRRTEDGTGYKKTRLLPGTVRKISPKNFHCGLTYYSSLMEIVTSSSCMEISIFSSDLISPLTTIPKRTSS